jgi:hypothetical protein
VFIDTGSVGLQLQQLMLGQRGLKRAMVSLAETGVPRCVVITPVEGLLSRFRLNSVVRLFFVCEAFRTESFPGIASVPCSLHPCPPFVERKLPKEWLLKVGDSILLYSRCCFLRSAVLFVNCSLFL